MPTGFQIGPLFVYYYGVLIMLGALLAGMLAKKLADKNGLDSELIWDMFVWLIIGGIIGARLWHVFTPPASMVEQGITSSYYFRNPLEILMIWKGGLGIPGAVIGGAIALWLYCRRAGQSFAKWADVIAPGLALAQAIGRIGNYVNQEVYGAPSNLPWAITIDEAHRLPEYAGQATYHPLFLYELLYNLLNMAILLFVGKKYKAQLRDGDIMLLYLMIYPFGRFFLEFLRLDPSPVAGININQTLMAVTFVIALIAFIARRRKPASAEPAEVAES
ncbi:MAG TPA: prolipoprotein diacylglyceryl transferase [Bellilinea sp.]|nr:prolipoprotein diacylglyceryl transferase [Bellilinea sp.]